MSSKYSGSTSFDFEIERCRNKQTGQFLTEDEAYKEALESPFGEEWFDLNYEYQLIKLEVEGSSYFAPGRYYGPPENCYPDEGDTEITSVIGPNKEDWESRLTEDEREDILNKIQDDVSSDGPDPDDYYDDYDYGDY